MSEYSRTNSSLKKKKITIRNVHSNTRSEVLHNQMTVQALCTSLLSCCLEINTDFSGKRKKSDYNSYCLFNLTKCKHFTAVLQIIGNRGTRHRLPC